MADDSSEDLVHAKLMQWAHEFLVTMAQYAAVLGVDVTLQQVLVSFLVSSLRTTERPLTRDEFMQVYDVFEKSLRENVPGFLTAEDPTPPSPVMTSEHLAEPAQDPAKGGAGVTQDTWARWEAQFHAR